MTLRATARTVLDLADARPPGLAGTRLVCVEGPAGSGKTTLAAALARAARDAGRSVTTVHTDDVLVGWAGLGDLGPTLLRDVVEPLAAGRAASYRRYDWVRASLAEDIEVPATDLLILEGVGSGHVGYAGRIAALVWVEAPPAVRRRRGLERDGEELMPAWDAFVVDEDRLHTVECTRGRADVLVDGLTGDAVPQAGAVPPSSGS